MSVVAFAEPSRTLAAAVDELVVLVRNQAGGACVWCGSRELWAASPQGDPVAGADCVVVTCRDCGAELVSEQTSQARSRRA